MSFLCRDLTFHKPKKPKKQNINLTFGTEEVSPQTAMQFGFSVFSSHEVELTIKVTLK